MRAVPLIVVAAAIVVGAAFATPTLHKVGPSGEHHIFATNAAGDPIGATDGNGATVWRFDRNLVNAPAVFKTLPAGGSYTVSCTYDHNLFYFAQSFGYRVYKGYDDGTTNVTPAFGSGVNGDVDGPAASARVFPATCKVMANGDVYFIQDLYQLVSIRKYSPATGQVTTVAKVRGTGLVLGDAATTGSLPAFDSFWLQHETQEVMLVPRGGGPLVTISSTGQISSTPISGPLCPHAQLFAKPEHSDASVIIVCDSFYLQSLDLTTPSSPTVSAPFLGAPDNGIQRYGYVFSPDNSRLWVNHRQPGFWGNAYIDNLAIPTNPPGTQDPAVAAYCAGIATLCAELDAQCTVIRSGNELAAAGDCDAAVLSCNAVHQDCNAKIQTCPVV